MSLVDVFMASLPRSMPAATALRDARIIAHRGEHDNRGLIENTMEAFSAARAAGVWGIECDIRFTADQVPVIHHDADASRLFGVGGMIRDMDLAQLRRDLPQVPTLEEVLSEFGGNCHLFLEIKDEPRPDARLQVEILQHRLAGLRPGDDFHMLALDPALFSLVPFLPRSCLYLVAELNVRAMERACLEGECGGLTGHYLLLHQARRKRLRAAGCGDGTGFIASANCLRRELNRGVSWLFSNDAVAMQSELDRLRQLAAAD